MGFRAQKVGGPGMKPVILQERMAKITDFHRAPCPDCRVDTLHLGPVCRVCGNELPPDQLPPEDRYRYPEPPKPLAAAAWRRYYGDVE